MDSRTRSRTVLASTVSSISARRDYRLTSARPINSYAYSSAEIANPYIPHAATARRVNSGGNSPTLIGSCALSVAGAAGRLPRNHSASRKCRSFTRPRCNSSVRVNLLGFAGVGTKRFGDFVRAHRWRVKVQIRSRSWADFAGLIARV